MTETILTNEELRLNILRAGMLPTGLMGRPKPFGHDPRVYSTTDEAAVAQSARQLMSQNFSLIPRDTRIFEPNFYSILLSRELHNVDHDSESVELRLVRDGANPLALALVGMLGSEQFVYEGPSVYLRGSVMALELSRRFISEYPGHVWRWMPVFDDFILS